MKAVVFALFVAVIAGLLPLRAEDKPRPLMREFMGLNVHTLKFKPELYAPVTRVLRNYHPVNWDLAEDTSTLPPFPSAKNRVRWEPMYRSWIYAGYRVHASLVFDDIKPEEWKDVEKDAFAYGRAFAQHFGPSKGLLEATEIGNEPGKYDDAIFRRLFESMARGVREGDPKMRIATAAASLGPSGRYAKSVELLKGLDDLWDILNVHYYAEVEPWPTWRRSYPEDPATNFVENVTRVRTWLDQNAPAKELWVTEFGYDASTKPPPKTGTFKDWIGSTEEQQAMWNVRSFLLLARLGADRAYVYYFNDDDTPHVHASSGLTRNFVPKPAFHAVAWLLSSLGDYRFSRALRESADKGYIYEFVHGAEADKRVLAVWKPAAPAIQTLIEIGPGKFTRAERMPLKAEKGEAVKVKVEQSGRVSLELTEKPVLLWIEAK